MPRKQRRARRYPAQPLLDKFPHDETHELAQRLGVSKHTIQNWRQPGYTFGEWEADRNAVRAGMHPSEVWTDWFDIPLTKDTWRHQGTGVGV